MTRGKKAFRQTWHIWLSSFSVASLWVAGIGDVRASEPDDVSVASSHGMAASLMSGVEIPSLPPLGSPNAYLPSASVTRLVLRLGQRRVYVYQGDREVASYPVAVGKPGWETPVGEHQVIQMIEDPAWANPFRGGVVPPGPNNPLGLRWIGFWTNGKNFIGFHGTPTVNSIGRAASHGCVRMYNKDVLALFEHVEMGTSVIVVP